jgi:hypothetical protein
LKSVDIRLDNSLDRPTKVLLNKNSIEIFERNKLFPDQEGSIEFLDLSDNRLSWIEYGAFDSFWSLKTLILSNNFVKIGEGNS